MELLNWYTEVMEEGQDVREVLKKNREMKAERRRMIKDYEKRIDKLCIERNQFASDEKCARTMM